MIMDYKLSLGQLKQWCVREGQLKHNHRQQPYVEILSDIEIDQYFQLSG